MNALGRVEPDQIAWLVDAMLGKTTPTNLERFESETGIHGQLWRKGRNVNLLTVMATEPGSGQFRRFIEACKAEYDCIGVWMIFNRDLASVLRRYGFKQATCVHDGAKLRGYRWRRAPPQEGKYGS